MTQPQLAQAAGVTKRTVIDWEAGRTSPTLLNIEHLMLHGLDGIFVLTGERAGARAVSRPPTQPTPQTGPIGLLVGKSRVLVYRPAETDRCLRCHAADQWQVGRITAECAACNTALPLVHPSRQSANERTDR
jgi:hypothetical protein